MPFPILNITPIPIRTDRTLRAVPYVTYALLFINLFVYLFNLGLSNYQSHLLSLQWGFIINKPSLVTLFTYAFLHASIPHLLGNLLILWLVGTVLESDIGSITFLMIYFASSMTAIIIYGLIGRTFLPDCLNSPLIGASGAVYGVTGLAALRFSRLRVLIFPFMAFIWLPISVPIPIPIWLPMWVFALWNAAWEVIAGMRAIYTNQSDIVAHWAHIGGLLLGVLVALLMQVVQQGKRESALEDSVRASAGTALQDRPLREVQRLLHETPNDPEVLEAMAALTLVNGEHERSRDCYARAIPLFLANGQRERAATCYMNILSIYPDMVLKAPAQMTVATTLEALKHFAEAVQAFRLMVEHYPEREEAQTAMLRSAFIYQRHLQNPLESKRLLQSCYAKHPDSPWSGMARTRLLELEKTSPAPPL